MREFRLPVWPLYVVAALTALHLGKLYKMQDQGSYVVHVEGADGREYASFCTLGKPLEFPHLGVTITVQTEDEAAAEAMEER